MKQQLLRRIHLRPVTVANRGDLDEIDAGPEARLWVHSNWYWHQQSLDNPNITFRLVHVQEREAAVGMVAYGPLYEDEALTRPMDGEYELIHLVIDHASHGLGIGRAVALSVKRALLALPDCRRVVVAANPKNTVAKAFFAGLGFVATDRKNYDGDPLLACVPNDA